MIRRCRALVIFITFILRATSPCSLPGASFPEQRPAERNSPTVNDLVASVHQLYAQKRWQEIVDRAQVSPRDPAELDYCRGMALAHLGRGEEAREAFQAGQKKQPRDKRFPIELAGLAFKQKQFADARRDLRRALRLDPNDVYALDFLATVELLEQNLEAALKLWNRVDKPRIEEVISDPQPRVDSVLLDHAFAFAPAAVLKVGDYRTTQARLALLGIFSRYQFELTPRPSDGFDEHSPKFDLLFRAVERNGWGDSKLDGALSLLRGVPFETVYPEYFNLGHSAMNLTSLVRWDSNKRRIFASLSAPLRRNPKWRYQFYADSRNENWDLSQNSHAMGVPLANLKLQKVEAGAGIRSVVNGRWTWNSGVDLSNRWFRNLESHVTPFFTDGFSLKVQAGLDYELLDLPEDRFSVRLGASEQCGRFFATPSNFFSRTQGSSLMHWFPKSGGDDYEISGELRAGRTQGRVPFDELFILGLERDNELWLRAHIGTRSGKKGSAPLGRDYILSNWEINRHIYQGRLFDVRLAPFLDTGRTYDANFGSREWLWDTGGQVKVRVLGGVAVVFTYGKDLRSGRSTYYVLVGH